MRIPTLLVPVVLVASACGVPSGTDGLEGAQSPLLASARYVASSSSLKVKGRKTVPPSLDRAMLLDVAQPAPDVVEPAPDAIEPSPDIVEPTPDVASGDTADLPDAEGTSPDPGAGALALEAVALSSSSLRLSWDAVPGARSIRVYLAPEPAVVPGQPMPAEAEMEVLEGDATRATLVGLAPDADHFVRVVADTGSGEVAGAAWARTPGGPRAVLDSPVREVHGLAPAVLQVVLANGTGAAWQAGPWKVARRDGTSLAVLEVGRQSVPVGAPSYSVGYGIEYRDDVIDVDHRISLFLDQPVGGPELLRVQGPGVDVLVPFSDRYLETPVVQLNQVGYNPRATRRYAYVSGWLGDAGGLSLADFPATADVLVVPSDPLAARTAVRAGLPIAPRSSLDKDAGTEVREIDLATVPADESAVYRVRIPGVGVSFRTAVSERAAFEAYYVVVRGLFFNRWHGDLNAAVTDHVRPPDHGLVYTAEGTDFDAKFPETQPKAGPRELVGGYHDAGDFDQRPMHTVVPQLLMRAYEAAPDRFPDGQVRIPESGNGIPDLLDEALWGVRAWEALQEDDGGVRMGVESTRHPYGYFLANEDRLAYWTYSRCPSTSARAAGIFAQASRLVAPFDPARAAGLRDRAIRAFAYAKANSAPASFRLYGAGELFRLTGDPAYKADFEAAWNAMGPYGAFSNMAEIQLLFSDYRAGQQAMPDYLMGYFGATGADESIRSATRTWLTTLSKPHLQAVDGEHAHRNPRPASYPSTWGQFTGSARHMDLVMARLAMGDLAAADRQKYFDALSLSADFALGGNPDGLVYFTGLGTRHPEEPLHLDSLAFVKLGKGTVPGIPVYGPVDGLNAATYQQPAKNAFHPAFDSLPLARRYADVRTVVQCAEFTVWESQAPFAELFGMLLGPGMEPAMLPQDGGPDLVVP